MVRSRTRKRYARTLAAALLAGVWTLAGLQARAARVLGRTVRLEQRKLLRRMMLANPFPHAPPEPWLAAHFADQPDFGVLIEALPQRRTIHVAVKSPWLAPAEPLGDLDLPPLATIGELAGWLGLTATELDWLDDERRQHRIARIPDLQHYTYTFVPRRFGPPRLIEAPKPRLKAVQHRILHEILDRVPAHERAFGFVKGRSCLQGAQAHAGEAVVLAPDLESFFASVRASRVHGIFRTLGYPHAVARALTGLTCTTTPAFVFDRMPRQARPDFRTRAKLETMHLAQGAPTSPALANLSA